MRRFLPLAVIVLGCPGGDATPPTGAADRPADAAQAVVADSPDLKKLPDPHELGPASDENTLSTADRSNAARRELSPEATSEHKPIGVSFETVLCAKRPEIARHLSPGEDTRHLVALAGRVGVPQEGERVTSDPARARDDDLETSWSCRPQGSSPCALSIVLDKPAKISAIRVFGGALARKSKRINGLRVHTAEGFSDVGVVASGRDRYVVFGEPVSTKRVTLEITGAPGPQPFRIAEIEVYGQGRARDGWDIDPATAHIDDPSAAWSSQSERSEPDLCLRIQTSDGHRPCWMRASALYGRAGDRFLLAEFMYGNPELTERTGIYLLIDQHTRRVLRLGPLGGVPTPVVRHRAGLGFLSLHRGEGGWDTSIRATDTRWSGAYWREGALRIVSEQRLDEIERAAEGFEYFARSRGGAPLSRPRGNDCSPLDGHEDSQRLKTLLDSLDAAGYGTETLRQAAEKTEEQMPFIPRSMVCKLGDGEVPPELILTGTTSSEDVDIIVLAGTKAIVLGRASRSEAVRVSRLRGGTAWVEFTPLDEPGPKIATVDATGRFNVWPGVHSLALRDPEGGSEFDSIDAAIEQPPLVVGNPESPALTQLAALPKAARAALLRETEFRVYALWAVSAQDFNGDGRPDADIRYTSSATVTYDAELRSTKSGGYDVVEGLSGD